MKRNSTSPDSEIIKLNFKILLNEVKISRLEEEYMSQNNNIMATLETINISDNTIEIDAPHYIIYENYELKNIQGENKSTLLNYSHTLLLDPKTYELFGIDKIKLKPLESFIDTLNVTTDINFGLSEPDTYLVRLKINPFENILYSNWDTLIVTN